MDQAAYDFPKAYAQAATLEGIGTFSESLEQNPVVDDLLLSQMWEMPTGIGDTTSWLRMYVQARYPAPVPASAHRAWELLHHGMYNCGCFDAVRNLSLSPSLPLVYIAQLRRKTNVRVLHRSRVHLVVRTQV